MIKEELIKKISSIILSEHGFGFEVFACLKKDGELSYCRFTLEDKDSNSFKDYIRDEISACISNKYLAEAFDLKQISDLHDNTHSLYEIAQNDNYSPFSFLNKEAVGYYKDINKPFLHGFLFKFILDDKKFVAYQQVYPVTIPQNKKGTFIYSQNNIYKEFKKDLLRIDYRVDLLIVDNSIITENINLLQNKFNFEAFIRNESQKTIDLIIGMNIVEDMGKIIAFEGKEKLTNAKKLMKIKDSPVLKMEKSVLIERLKTLSRYKGKLKIENDVIQVNTNKDVIELLKILNDDYLISELTEKSYESSSKVLEENM